MKRRNYLAILGAGLISATFVMGMAGCGDGQKERVEMENGKYVPELNITMARYSSPAMEEALAKTENAETVEYNRFNDLFKEKLGINITYDWIVDSSQYSKKADHDHYFGKYPRLLCSHGESGKTALRSRPHL